MDTFELNKEKFYAYRNLRQDMQGQFFWRFLFYRQKNRNKVRQKLTGLLSGVVYKAEWPARVPGIKQLK